MTLDVQRVGSGPPVLLVHGSIVGAARTWRKQMELAERFSLVVPNRPGFGGSPPLERGDFEVEAPMIAELLGEGAHLVGHSYGAVIALLVAAMRPEAVWSLTVSEPGCLRIAAGHPEVDATLADGELLYAAREQMPLRDFVSLFRAGVHSSHVTPEELPDWLEHGARLAQAERAPWEADVPMAELAAAPFPKLVISGGHSRTFELVCDELAAGIGARREVLAGRGHTIPGTGRAYNDLLCEFLASTTQPA